MGLSERPGRTEDTVDTVVEYTIAILKAGREAVNLVPGVPGLVIAVDILLAILKKVEAAKANRRQLESLCKEIESITHAIQATSQAVRQGLTEFLDGSEGQETVAKVIAGSELAERVCTLENQLFDILRQAHELMATRRSMTGRWWHSKRDAGKIDDLRTGLANARFMFEFEGNIAIQAQVERIVELMKDSEKRAQEEHERAEQARIRAEQERIRAEQEHVLNSIPQVSDAHYLSAANAMKSRLEPTTREEVFSVLNDWATGRTEELRGQSICVLVGEAGTGKSTIASEFCKRLEQNGRLGASWFFDRGIHDLASPAKLFSTISAQLARSRPSFREPFVDAARKHMKTVPLQQVRSEFEDLLRIPFSSIPSTEPPIVVVIDALDECTENAEALIPIILNLLLSYAAQEESPLRVFLTSRPEPHYIFRTLELSEIEARTFTLQLSSFLTSVHRDIEVLIRARLDSEPASRQWSAHDPSVVSRLVERADGLFIYARTAVDFLLQFGTSRSMLQERLDALIDTPQELSPIDQLYHIILTTAFPSHAVHQRMQDRVRCILGYLAAFHETEGVSPRTLQDLTGMSAHLSVPILNLLRSVIFFEHDNPDSCFRLVHATFREFLVDKNRSKKFHVDTASTHRQLAYACGAHLRAFRGVALPRCTGFELLLRLLNYEELPSLEFSPHLLYACKHLKTHCDLSDEFSAEGNGKKWESVAAHPFDRFPSTVSLLAHMATLCDSHDHPFLPREYVAGHSMWIFRWIQEFVAQAYRNCAGSMRPAEKEALTTLMELWADFMKGYHDVCYNNFSNKHDAVAALWDALPVITQLNRAVLSGHFPWSSLIPELNCELRKTANMFRQRAESMRCPPTCSIEQMVEKLLPVRQLEGRIL